MLHRARAISGFGRNNTTDLGVLALDRVRQDGQAVRNLIPALPPVSVSMDWLTDRRSRYTAELLGALWVLAMADLFFTLWAHLFTPFRELNPLARAMLAQNMLSTLVIYKITVTLLGTAIFWRLRGYTRAELALLAVVVVYILLALRWSDYTAGTIADISSVVHLGPHNC